MRDDQRALLRAALLDDEREARASLTWWRAHVDLDLIDPDSRRLLPLLARRMGELAPDDPVLGRVRGNYRHTFANNLVLWRETTPAISELMARAIPVMLVGGVALLDAYGDDWGARPLTAVEALVPIARVGEAVDALGETGWAPAQGQSPAWVRARALARRSGWTFARAEGRLDLRWRPLPGATSGRLDDALWSAARPTSVDDLAALGLDRADELLRVLVRGARGDGELVQWVADTFLLLRRGFDGAARERIARVARAAGEEHHVVAALETVVAVLDAEALVAPLLAELSRRRIDRARAAAMAREAQALVGNVLDLDLTTDRAAALTHAATLDAPAVAAMWRRRLGSFVRTPLAPVPLAMGDVLDFSEPETLDRYGATGWSITEPRGAVTRAHEARLVLPLAPGVTDVVVRITLEAVWGEARVAISANERDVQVVTVPQRPTTMELELPAELVTRFSPLELAFRPAGLRQLASRLRVRVARLELSAPTTPGR